MRKLAFAAALLIAVPAQAADWFCVPNGLCVDQLSIEHLDDMRVGAVVKTPPDAPFPVILLCRDNVFVASDGVDLYRHMFPQLHLFGVLCDKRRGG